MVKVKTNNPYMAQETLDVTQEKADYLVSTGDYVFIDTTLETIVKENTEEIKEPEKSEEEE